MENTAYCFADAATQQTVEIVDNVPLARQTYRLRFRCPLMAQRITPGQFLMLRLHEYDDPLIGRPLALYDTVALDGERVDAVDVVYLVAGKLTTRLQHLVLGQRLDVWGPLGNGFPAPSTDHLIMVAGGIGQTPFVAVAKEALGLQTYGDPPRRASRVGRVTLCYGARSAEYLAGIDDFRAAGVEVRVSTDDGSAGRRGLVTDVLAEVLDETAGQERRVICCGPEAMMKAVSVLTRRHAVPTQVSLETPMACGIGICFSCVATVLDDQGQPDYRRTCVEGPVFDAERICWDD
jgi:dihydroorotate dehydrogenase electron transfer subunit